MDDDDNPFEMVMPIVVVRSNGGPYDDESYVAGVELGALDARLHAARHHGLGLPQVFIRPGNVAQVDLLAMNVGAKMRILEMPAGSDPEVVAGWRLVSFEWTVTDDGDQA